MKLLDTKQAAEYLFGENASSHTLVQWRCKKIGPAYVKILSRVRYRQEDLDAYIAANLQSTPDHEAAKQAGGAA